MSRYVAGRRLEYEIQGLFERDGWHVTRSAGSHGKWDLVAIKRGRRDKQVWMVLLQAKSGAGILTQEPQ